MSAFVPNVDERLPEWARRSNPVVRRQLGAYWKTIPPQAEPIIRLYLLQMALVVISIPLPFLLDISIILVMVSIIVIPVLFYMYGRLLLGIIIDSSTAMATELSNNTLHLLLTTPLSRRSIYLGKVAASMWRQMDDLSIIILMLALFNTPPIVLQYLNFWPVDEYGFLPHVAVMLGTGAALIRMIIEPFMVGAFGVMLGAALGLRGVAIMATISLTVFYFLFINLIRYVAMIWPLQLVVDFVLPVALPVILTWACLRFTDHLLTRD